MLKNPIYSAAYYYPVTAVLDKLITHLPDNYKSIQR